MAKFVKVVVFVPKTFLEIVRQAMFAAGAGQIGKKYDNCTFISYGEGTFRALPGADPYIGKIGKVETVKEARLETIVAKKDLKKIIKAIKKAHPYEEPAIDIIPLLN